MAKIMMISKYPPHKINEVIKNYMSSNKPVYPDYLKKVGAWAAQVTDDRHKTYAIYECPDDKIVEGFTALSKRFSFYASVEGVTYTMELLMDADEAIKLMLKK